MKEKDKNVYLLKKIVIPILVILVCGILGYIIPNFIKVQKFNFIGIEFSLEKQVSMKIIKAFSVLILLSLPFIQIRKKNKEEIFLNGNIYGDIPYFLYKLAKLLGYKNIDLKLIPIPIIFKIVLNDDFYILDSYKNKKSVKVNVKSDYSNFKVNNNLKECNLVIADTYEINLNEIPKSKRCYNIIIIDRERKKDVIERIYSEEFVLEVGKAINKIKNKDIKINIYMTTNIWNTEKIISDYFKVGCRDRYKIEVFNLNLEKNIFEKTSVLNLGR